jgi:hypothetical protein
MVGKMDCKHIANKVWLYVEGDLKPREQQRVARHIASCRQCTGLVREVTDSQLWLKSSETERFEDVVLDNVRRGARQKIVEMGDARFGWLGFFARVNWKPLILAVPVIVLMCWLAVHWLSDKKRNSTAPGQVAESGSYLPNNTQDKPDISDPAAGTGSSYRMPGHHKRRAGRLTGLEHSKSETRNQLAAIRETSQPAPLRIEIQTEDPNVRIIWFTSPGDGAVLSGPDR